MHEQYKFQGRFTCTTEAKRRQTCCRLCGMSETFDLHSFPFDSHLLQIRISSEVRQHRQYWSVLKKEAGQLTRPGIPAQWSQTDSPIVETERSGIYLHKFSIKIYVKRNPSFFLYNVVLTMALLCFVAFSASLVGPERIGERAAILLTALLVTAGYRHMTSQWVPHWPYYTILDWYTLAGFLCQVAALLESVYVVQFGCKPVSDSDGKIDGQYNGTYMYRNPPDFECSKAACDWDQAIFTAIFYGWLAAHAVGFLCLRRFSPGTSWQQAAAEAPADTARTLPSQLHLPVVPDAVQTEIEHISWGTLQRPLRGRSQ